MAIRTNGSSICQNKAVRFHYEILDDLEAGIVLKGSEVKSLRIHNPNISSAFVFIKDNELFIKNLDIPTIEFSREKHNPKEDRKLLVHKRELLKMSNKLKKGFSIVPLSIYFTKRGFVKLRISIAKGKKLYDKRRVEKEKDVKREKMASMKMSKYN